MRLFKKRSYLSSRELYIILVFCIVIFILSLYRPLLFIKEDLNVAINSGFKLSNFDILCCFQTNNGLIDFQSYMFIIIPLFSALIIYIIDTNNSLLKIIKYKDRNTVWNKNILLILISAFLLSTLLVIGGYLVSGVILKGFNNTWNTELGLPYKIYGTTEIWSGLSNLLVTYKVILIFWITTFLGLSFIGVFICTFKLFIRNVYVYIIIIAVLFSDFYNVINFIIILKISINSNNWLHTSSIIINNIYFLVGFFVLYFWGRYINSQKDQGIAKKY